MAPGNSVVAKKKTGSEEKFLAVKIERVIVTKSGCSRPIVARR